MESFHWTTYSSVFFFKLYLGNILLKGWQTGDYIVSLECVILCLGSKVLQWCAVQSLRPACTCQSATAMASNSLVRFYEDFTTWHSAECPHLRTELLPTLTSHEPFFTSRWPCSVPCSHVSHPAAGHSHCRRNRKEGWWHVTEVQAIIFVITWMHPFWQIHEKYNNIYIML